MRNTEEIQLGNDTNNPMWNEILKLYYGDPQTVEYMLAIGNIRSSAKRPGLWHLRCNFSAAKSQHSLGVVVLL